MPDMWNLGSRHNWRDKNCFITSMEFRGLDAAEATVEAYCTIQGIFSDVINILTQIPNENLNICNYKLDLDYADENLLQYIRINSNSYIRKAYFNKLESADKYFALYCPFPEVEVINYVDWCSKINVVPMHVGGHTMYQHGLRQNPSISGTIYCRNSKRPSHQIMLKQRQRAWRTCIFK